MGVNTLLGPGSFIGQALGHGAKLGLCVGLGLLSERLSFSVFLSGFGVGLEFGPDDFFHAMELPPCLAFFSIISMASPLRSRIIFPQEPARDAFDSSTGVHPHRQLHGYDALASRHGRA